MVGTILSLSINQQHLGITIDGGDTRRLGTHFRPIRSSCPPVITVFINRGRTHLCFTEIFRSFPFAHFSDEVECLPFIGRIAFIEAGIRQIIAPGCRTLFHCHIRNAIVAGLIYLVVRQRKYMFRRIQLGSLLPQLFVMRKQRITSIFNYFFRLVAGKCKILGLLQRPLSHGQVYIRQTCLCRPLGRSFIRTVILPSSFGQVLFGNLQRRNNNQIVNILLLVTDNVRTSQDVFITSGIGKSGNIPEIAHEMKISKCTHEIGLTQIRFLGFIAQGRRGFQSFYQLVACLYHTIQILPDQIDILTVYIKLINQIMAFADRTSDDIVGSQS